MLKKHSVEGFEAFKSKVEELSKEETPLFVYFSGSKNAEGIVMKKKCKMKLNSKCNDYKDSAEVNNV